MSLQPGTRIGPYEVIGPLGAGGMGQVFRARDTTLDREVALKILPESFALDPDRVARFAREAKSLAALNHPNIAQIYGVEGDGPGQLAEQARPLAIVMELVPGEDLAAMIARGPVAVDEALAIARQIASALEAAHDAGIIHRDLKPANVRVRADGTVKVLDFGLAKAADPVDASGVSAMNSPTMTGHGHGRATELGVILGTAAYMAPEQAKGRIVDRRVDVWAFGVVLYEMLTGTRAFGGEDVTEIMAAVMRDTPSLDALPAGTPPGVHRLLRRCLQKDPRKRLRDMGDVGVELDESAGGADVPSAEAPPLAPMPSRPSTMVLTVAALALVAVASLATWGLTSTPGIDRPIVRFELPPPAGQLLAETMFPSLAISRDGRRIAYLASGGLYVRDFDEAAPRLIVPELTMSQGIGFSPTGDWVIYRSATGLWRVPLAGGPAELLAPGASPFGFSWTDDGRILLGGQDGVFVIPETGGTPELLFEAKGEQTATPQLLPGNKLVLYGVATATSGAVVVQALDGGPREVVLDQITLARYVASGHLIYGVEGRMMAAAFDLESGRVVGTPVPLAEPVAWSPLSRVGQIAVSDTGTMVRYPTASDWEAQALVWVDRSGASQPTSAEPRRYSDPRISPDGQRVVLQVWDPGADAGGSLPRGGDIWIADLARGGLTRMSFDPQEDETPVWSPNGNEVAYSSARATARWIFRKRADGSASEPEIQVWEGVEHTHVTDWTPDGKLLVQIQRGANNEDLIAVDVDSGLQTPLFASTFNERQGRVSPNGQWVAYTSDESGREEVYVQTYPALDGRVPVSTGGGGEPVWSRDNTTLYFRTSDQLMAATVLSTSPLRFSAPEPVFPDRFARTPGLSHVNFDVAPDGRFLFIDTPPEARTAEPGERRTIHVVLNWLEELKRLVPVR